MTTVAKHQPLSAASSHAPAKGRPPLPDPVNVATGKPYWGDTKKLLAAAALAKGYTSHEWGTLRQWNGVNRSIGKNEKGTAITFYEVVDCLDGSTQQLPVKAHVYNRAQLKRAKDN